MKTPPAPKPRSIKEPDIIGLGLAADSAGNGGESRPDDDGLDDFGPDGTFPKTMDT